MPAPRAPVTTSSGNNSHIEKLYNAQSPSEVREAYNAWASQFDADVGAQNYIAPTYVAEAILTHKGNISGEIFDAGCGTGLSGLALSKAGAKTIDGVDLSEAMLEIAAKTGLYRSLSTADLSDPIVQPDSRYDIVTCVGTLTHGHVGPIPSLQEFVRITKTEGLVVATVIDDIWESHGYKAECEKLQSQGMVEVLSTESKPYREKAGVNARIVVLRKP